MPVVVTGASGHVGGNLVRELLKQKRRVRAVVRHDIRALEGLDVEIVQADVRDITSLVEAFRDADTVFHLAAMISIVGEMGGKVQATNVKGAGNVADACLACGVKRLVHFSSVHAYHQDQAIEPLDETREFALDARECAYDRSKAMGQLEILKRVERGLNAVIVNPTAVIGRHDYRPSRMGQTFLQMASGRLPSLIEGGFDWVDVRDICQGALAAEMQGKRGENYLLSGTYTTVKVLHEMISEISGSRVPRFVCPQWLAKIGAPFAQSASLLTGKEPLFTLESLHALRANKKISHEKAARDLGYNPRPLKETLRDIHQWWVAQGQLVPRNVTDAKETMAHV